MITHKNDIRIYADLTLNCGRCRFRVTTVEQSLVVRFGSTTAVRDVIRCIARLGDARFLAGMHRLLLQMGLTLCLMHPMLPVLGERAAARRIRPAARLLSRFLPMKEGM
ncbi:MAG TPA: hypothetical protein ACFCUC_07075 [Desulfobacterales bacterium]